MNRYLVNIELLVNRLLPTTFKKVVFWRVWIATLLTPLQTLHSAFLVYAQQARKEASYNSQTAVFEFLLNERFNNSQTGIFIDNVFFNLTIAQEYRFYISETGFGYPSNYWKFLSEANPQNYSVFQNELFSFGATFIVNVPVALQGVIDENELRAVIDRYRLADKTYSINYY
jgi:hypothetical protein